ncbi:lantibiotic immunity ABC transporter MutG family permease subunit [Thermoclostridium stercorarium]|uniref:lantibiotic immunity ABC transporter MutG family permease subunit n=1 Tax=Thermoclostridium stercorarium TaxID=1510 RepID=UPI00224927C4|nr:lantibiotic immunity ABC transporter MutG family permease subunit [Thermoclostridium stercorarium]UZQ85725.1 lantibiotic immunity ABC transporter MutG family permease subunit [Thermoclostridium stercorarium]
MYVGVLTGITVHQEELAGNFSGLLLNSVSRHRLYWAKLLMLLLSTGISTTTAVLTVGVGFKIILGVSMNWIIFISAAVFTVIGTIPLLALHLWAGFKWGMGTSIGIGAAGLLVAALMGVTVLGDKVWQFVPWTWPVRLSMLCGIYLQFIENMQASLDIINLGFISKQLTTGLMSVLFCFAVAGTGGTIWFNRWEGRKSYE